MLLCHSVATQQAAANQPLGWLPWKAIWIVASWVMCRHSRLSSFCVRDLTVHFLSPDIIDKINSGTLMQYVNLWLPCVAVRFTQFENFFSCSASTHFLSCFFIFIKYHGQTCLKNFNSTLGRNTVVPGNDSVP